MLVNQTLPSRDSTPAASPSTSPLKPSANRGLVRDTVIVRVEQQAYPIRVVSQPLDLVAVEHFAHVLHALRGQFLVQPIHVLADVGNALVQSERLTT